MFTNVSIELKLPGIYYAGKRHIKAVNRDDVHDLIPSEILTGTFLCRFANSAAFNELVDDTQQNLRVHSDAQDDELTIALLEISSTDRIIAQLPPGLQQRDGGKGFMRGSCHDQRYVRYVKYSVGVT